jgi:hypothetical protein
MPQPVLGDLHVCEGVELRKGLFEIFSAPMLAFAD